MGNQGELFIPPSPFDEKLAKRLPSKLLFGTSTWTYPGWKGQVYRKHYSSEKDFKQNSLSEYAEHGWFRTVGIDSFFYNPPKLEVLEYYSKQVPTEFQWVSKMWEQLTIPKFPNHARYGSQKGTINPDFLNADLCKDAVLKRFDKASIFQHTGPFVFQFPHIPTSVVPVSEFIDKLHSFLSKLPQKFRYAIEVRNKEFLCHDYFQVLNASGATHCFNHWSYMPGLKEQMRAAADAGGLSADFYTARILTPLGVSYQEAVKKFQPYDSIKARLPDMRADVITLAKRALETNRSAFVIINNRSEGNAPLTIAEIGAKICQEL